MPTRKAEPPPIAELYGEIYRVVRRIPRGRVATYGQVAELSGLPGGSRTVGRAMKLSTPQMRLPWQRVVGRKSRGAARVSILDPVGGAVQRMLLEKEGVKFSTAGSISLHAFGWLPAADSPARLANVPRGDARPKKRKRR